MPDRCEVLPGDAVVARRGGGLLWVDAPGSPALVSALHACLGVSGPGADRVLAAVAGQVSSLASGGASFALVLGDDTGSGVALWAGKGQPAVDGVPVSGSSVEGGTLASGFSLGQSLYVGPGQSAPRTPPGVSYDLVEGTVPGGGATLHLAAAAPSSAAPATSAAPASSFSAPSDSAFGSSRGSSRGSSAARPESGEQTAFWRPDSDNAAPILRFDDGLVVTVDEDLVLGRRPDNHEMVTSGSARPVPIADTQNVLSSAHAALTRNGREVSLVDLGSLNGTHVAGPEATEWTQLEPGVAHPLSDGDRLLLGWTVITFEQPQD
ncbi:FHA domain-containing protein [Blastococcus sp. TF02-8]|uniref:FHA domain-containing protein n=1 Tax=Blastococcus sp. TF02-8 TaxID=2250574 RepID=UPI000DE876BC|nr:FHA domain-containing protein [Blastococcus sp. TF02-8]RBY96618.1 FHA domain-containing protein [Blastococcus sp. TF02-8]